MSDQQHLAKLGEYCIRSTKAYTYQCNRNQFINFPQFYDELLHFQYNDFLAQLREVLKQSGTNRKSVQCLFDCFTEASREITAHSVITLYRLSTRRPPETSLLKTVMCAKYSPQFQLRLLGLDIVALMGPILDYNRARAQVKFLWEKQRGASSNAAWVLPGDPHLRMLRPQILHGIKKLRVYLC